MLHENAAAAMAASTPREDAMPSHGIMSKDVATEKSKRVTWAAEDKLNQVRLFDAEDAPSLSGSMPQGFLEAKVSKFKHAAAPISSYDLPPGFEEFKMKRAKLHASADSTVIAMATQIRWHCPERFLYDPLWQVAFGNESFEVTSQMQREVETLEAVYPRLSGIPPSSVEPQENAVEAEDSKVPQIPIMPVEDEEETKDDHVTGVARYGVQSLSRGSGGKACYSPPMNEKYLDVGGPSKGIADHSSAFFKSANPDVAAAAAAAYAVMKAKESGTLIDQDLLIEILTNPLLIETLNSSNLSIKSQLGDDSCSMPLYRANAYGSAQEMMSETSNKDASAGLHGTHIMRGRQRYDTSEANVVPGLQGSSMAQVRSINVNASLNSQGRILFPTSREPGNAISTKGMVGQKRRAYGRSYSLPPQDMPRELIQQHGSIGNPGMVNTDTQLRQNATLTSFDDVKQAHDLERHWTNPPTVLKGQTWLPSSSGRSNSSGGQLDRPSGPKIRKQCFFFNTAKGCRNGIYCHFMHEIVSEKPQLGRTNSDVNQSMKTAKMEVTNTE